MRLIRSLGLTTLLIACPAVASVANVYSSFSTASTEEQSLPDHAVDPSTARLVLAKQLGLSNLYDLNDINEDTILALNAYGGPQKGLFADRGDKHAEQQRKTLFLLETDDSLDSPVVPDGFTHFQIPNPPTLPSEHEQLLKEFRHQSDMLSHRHAQRCRPYKGSYQQSMISDAMSHSSFGLDVQNVVADGCIVTVAGSLKSSSDAETNTALERFLRHVSAFTKDSRADVIVMTVPSPTPSTGWFKRSTSPTWFAARDAQRPPIVDRPLDPAIMDEDDLFAEPTRHTLQDDKNAGPSSSRSLSSLLAGPTGNTTPPRGILPSCYTTESACNNVTHSCSGHGSCKLRYSLPADGKSDSSTRRLECWACECVATVVRSRESQGDKTTRWSGPACQKKDVSREFWMLGGTTVALVGVVAWGISLLYGMGSEELPSVIGAGVTGLGARGR